MKMKTDLLHRQMKSQCRLMDWSTHNQQSSKALETYPKRGDCLRSQVFIATKKGLSSSLELHCSAILLSRCYRSRADQADKVNFKLTIAIQ